MKLWVLAVHCTHSCSFCAASLALTAGQVGSSYFFVAPNLLLLFTDFGDPAKSNSKRLVFLLSAIFGQIRGQNQIEGDPDQLDFPG
jgi:hypothetical protein